MSFHEVSGLLLDALPWPYSRIILSVVLGLIFGFMAYNRGMKNKVASEAEEEQAEKPEPEPAQEEEIIETKHYMFH